MEIWVNPDCSKCGVATAALDEAGVDYTVRRYLDEPPTAAELEVVLARLGLEPWEVARTGEQAAAQVGLAGLPQDAAHRADWVELMVAHPILIQRPIITTDDGRGVIGRSPEALAGVLAREREAEARFAPSPVDAVVFDLGNVLIRWDAFAAIAAGVGPEQAQALLSAEDFDFAAWNHEQDAGRSWDEGEAEAARSHPHWAPALRAYRQHFPCSLTGPVADTVEVLRELHAAGVVLFALTNWSQELFPAAVDRFDFLGLFEDIVVSGEEGVAKPDPEIFEVLEERLRHRGSLEDSVFIDDNPANVLAAEVAGMDGILFTDTGHLREDLRARGLPLRRA